jgi:hypothetical protein
MLQYFIIVSGNGVAPHPLHGYMISGVIKPVMSHARRQLRQLCTERTSKVASSGCPLSEFFNKYIRNSVHLLVTLHSIAHSETSGLFRTIFTMPLIKSEPLPSMFITPCYTVLPVFISSCMSIYLSMALQPLWILAAFSDS